MQINSVDEEDTMTDVDLLQPIIKSSMPMKLPSPSKAMVYFIIGSDNIFDVYCCNYCCFFLRRSSL